jgi:hypothetical protein
MKSAIIWIPIKFGINIKSATMEDIGRVLVHSGAEREVLVYRPNRCMNMKFWFMKRTVTEFNYKKLRTSFRQIGGRRFFSLKGKGYDSASSFWRA